MRGRLDDAVETLCDLDIYRPNLFELFTRAWPHLSNRVRDKVIGWGYRHFCDDATEEQFAFLEGASVAAYQGHWRALDMGDVIEDWNLISQFEADTLVAVVAIMGEGFQPATVH